METNRVRVSIHSQPRAVNFVEYQKALLSKVKFQSASISITAVLQ